MDAMVAVFFSTSSICAHDFEFDLIWFWFTLVQKFDRYTKFNLNFDSILRLHGGDGEGCDNDAGDFNWYVKKWVINFVLVNKSLKSH